MSARSRDRPRGDYGIEPLLQCRPLTRLKTFDWRLGCHEGRDGLVLATEFDEEISK